MTYKPLITMFFDQWGGMYKGDDSFQKRYHKNRIIYRWSIGNINCYRFLLDIRPFVIVKKEQVELAIRFQDHVTENKRFMVGSGFKDTSLQKERLSIRAKLFDERAAMSLHMRQLKKENFPLVANDP